MSNAKKRIDQVHKLLRLAAKSSGAGEHERISAALAAAELFVELEDKLNADKREARAEQTSTPHRHPQPQYYDDEPVSHSASEDRFVRSSPPNIEPWQRSMAPRHFMSCQNMTCKKPIGFNERVWRRVNCGKEEYLHDNCPRPGETGF